MSWLVLIMVSRPLDARPLFTPMLDYCKSSFGKMSGQLEIKCNNLQTGVCCVGLPRISLGIDHIVWYAVSEILHITSRVKVSWIHMKLKYLHCIILYFLVFYCIVLNLYVHKSSAKHHTVSSLRISIIVFYLAYAIRFSVIAASASDKQDILWSGTGWCNREM